MYLSSKNIRGARFTCRACMHNRNVLLFPGIYVTRSVCLVWGWAVSQKVVFLLLAKIARSGCLGWCWAESHTNAFISTLGKNCQIIAVCDCVGEMSIISNVVCTFN